MESSEHIPNFEINQHQQVDVLTMKLLQALRRAKSQGIKFSITLPAQNEQQDIEDRTIQSSPTGKGHWNEQMRALVRAIAQEITDDTQDSQEKALQQLFDMISVPIITLYPELQG